MARVVLIHPDVAVLRRLAGYLQAQHEFLATDKLLIGIKHLLKLKPEAVVVAHDTAHRFALKLLTYMRDHRVRAAVVAVWSPDGKSSLPRLARLGARSFVPVAVEAEALEEAIRTAISVQAAEQSGPPPISEEEAGSNLSILERDLNGRMKCFAGTNQVFIYSRVLGGATTKPRIMLRCPLRPEYGLKRDVYYEYIRDVCCGQPEACEAYRRFTAERESA